MEQKYSALHLFMTVHNNLPPCSHEEADTRMMVHVVDAMENSHKSDLVNRDSNSWHRCGCFSCCWSCNCESGGALGVLWDRKKSQGLTHTSLC